MTIFFFIFLRPTWRLYNRLHKMPYLINCFRGVSPPGPTVPTAFSGYLSAGSIQVLTYIINRTIFVPNFLSRFPETQKTSEETQKLFWQSTDGSDWMKKRYWIASTKGQRQCSHWTNIKEVTTYAIPMCNIKIGLGPKVGNSLSPLDLHQENVWPNFGNFYFENGNFG